MIMNCMAPCCSQIYWLKLAEDETVHVRRGIPANCPFARGQTCFHRCFGLAKRFPYLCLVIFHCKMFFLDQRIVFVIEVLFAGLAL